MIFSRKILFVDDEESQIELMQNIFMTVSNCVGELEKKAQRLLFMVFLVIF